MKRTESLYRTAVLLLLLMLAAACTRDDTFDDAAPGNGTDPAAVLTITVTDGAYAPEASAANAVTDHGAPATRAVENGFATGFTKGDKIGLYVADAKVYGPGNLNDLRITASNLCLTYDGTRWTLPADTELEYDPAKGRDILYFAYYPYQANMDGNEPDGTSSEGWFAATAPEFFHALITRWKPLRDQSTYAAYTASDLMVARGKVATRTDGTPGFVLSFTMEHQMQLNVVRLPYIKSTYTEEISGGRQTKSCDLYTGARVPDFWMENHHTARLITNPSDGTKKITGCYYYDSRSVERKFDIEIPRKDDLRGKYKTYTIDGAEESKSKRGAPQEGDFYMKDGTVLPQEAFGGGNLPADVKQDCIGVVFWVGEKDGKHWTQTGGKKGDHLLMDEHPACTHGMVVALTDAASDVAWATNPEDKTLWDWADAFNGFTDNEKSLWEMILASDANYGYVYNALFGLYTAHNKGTDFPAYEAVKTYAGIHSTPEGCSGWLFPGRHEQATMWFGAPDSYPDNSSEYYAKNMVMFKKINPQVKKAGGIELKGRYWSSSDYSNEKTWTTTSDPTDSSYGLQSQTEGSKVRAVLAF